MAKNIPASVTKMEAKWQAESDLRTLAEARRIKNDPKRMAAVKKCAEEQMKAAAVVVAAAEDKDD